MSDNRINNVNVDIAGKLTFDGLAGYSDGLGGITYPASPTVLAVVSAEVIPSSSKRQRCTLTAAATVCDIAAGVVDGQVLAIQNSTTTVLYTITISGAHVLLDASSDGIVIKAASVELFVWDAALALWLHVGPFGG